MARTSGPCPTCGDKITCGSALYPYDAITGASLTECTQCNRTMHAICCAIDKAGTVLDATSCVRCHHTTAVLAKL